MALTKLTADVENIQALSDKPNEIEGLTPDQLKKKFDDGNIDVKTYLNDTLTVEQDAINASLDGRLDTAETNITTLQTQNSGWKATTGTFSYASADDPTFVMNTSVDLTGSLSVGMKIKLTQTTTKYFFITAITASTITLYGGTDYDLVNAAISNVFYATEKAPYGFPLDPDKWSVTFTDVTSRSQNTPTNGVWYNLSSQSLVVPIGSWNLSYANSFGGAKGSAAFLVVRETLSTTNNGETDNRFTRIIDFGNAALDLRAPVCAENIVNLTSKTTYYLNVQAGAASMTSIYSTAITTIKAVCAYL